ncbi:MotA/TolQ/ExbB proton channel family protein [Solimonas sp. K1W22B-7]|uniref:MotA/TolQ/ExbB proton channel family protein n=1 Tax=Solimonas sp. K1W22B-7 TaxID=2303331 RepID=UPI000E331B0E|nr:MotA/TolQ/ExbB proton channel family protein [Solimonas sp. K1W22B-7]AXQ29091.1 MotA/TolQ/ExbB proton channel family protein [Solimonas sp. K1W22B-7]
MSARKLLCALALLPGIALAQTQAKGMDDLLNRIRQDGAASAKLNQEREARFLRDRSAQAEMLQKAEAEHASVKARSDAIRARYEANQKQIAELKEQFKTRAGDYTQVAATVRQAAADFRSHAGDSPLSTQFPERLAVLDALSADDAMPGQADIEKLWFVLQQEMTENGRVARFQGEVVDTQGSSTKEEVIRVGAFTAFRDGDYLVPQPGGNQLLELLHQPERGFRSLARKFADRDEATAPILIDPTGGTLLAQEALRPSLGERIEQGGAVGYVIIAVGLVGAVLAIWQLAWLLRTDRAVRRQLDNVAQPSQDNPLGRVLATFKGDPNTAAEDAEVIELRLSEAVLREVPKLERFQAFLRLAVAAGPLLGLIGTVVGMIITFQVITEQGAGDPRMMAEGISQAMIATVLGLGIAVPLLFINSLLAARSRVITQILDEQATGLLAERLEKARA